MAIGDTVQAGLMRIDSSPILLAGQAQARVGEQLGQTVGGMIEQYQLNKEKQKKADARIKSAMNGMSEFVQAGVLSPEQKTMAEEFLNDPNKSSVEKVAFIEEQEKRLFQLPKLQLMQNQNRIAGLDADLKEATQQSKIAMSGLELAAKDLSNRKSALEESLLTIKSETERDKVRAQLDLLNEQIEAQKSSNEFLAKTEEDRNLQVKLKSASLIQNLTKGATEIKALEKKMETFGQLDPLEQQRLLTLQSEQVKNLAEADNLQKQSEQLQGVLDASKTPTKTTNDPAVKLDDLNIAAQGDIAGQFKGAINAVVGYISGGTPFKADAEGKAQVEVINQQLRPAFVKALSDKGSVYTQQEINKILPQTNDNDGAFRAKITKLPALLRRQVEIDQKTVSAGIGTESQKKQAFDNIQKLPALADALDQIIAREQTSQNTGTTSTNIKFRILD
tara:strand:- start:682 stop:2025 length:1344 start_codon:yes stop_codon:yes gene_type:complete